MLNEDQGLLLRAGSVFIGQVRRGITDWRSIRIVIQVRALHLHSELALLWLEHRGVVLACTSLVNQRATLLLRFLR